MKGRSECQKQQSEDVCPYGGGFVYVYVFNVCFSREKSLSFH